MRVALGFKAHSGWAAMVAVGLRDATIEIVDRRRIELVDARNAWARAPYHAADARGEPHAKGIVERGIDIAHRVAAERLRSLVAELDAQHQVAVCAVLVPNPMPAWSTEEILAVHFRMHKAEGVLFPDALVRGAKACGLRCVIIPEKDLVVSEKVAALGKAIGPPWGKDQKGAAQAAILALYR